MSKDRFIRKLSENLTSIQISARSYDLGHDGEGPRIAAALRVLFHSGDGKRSKGVSLVRHLKIEDWPMLSSPSSSPGIALDYISIKIDLKSSTPVKAIARFGIGFAPVSMQEWWGGHPIYTFQNRKYSRSDLIKVAANQDGGAHVDSSLRAFYQDMEAGAQGLTLNGQNLSYLNDKAPFDRSQPQHCRNFHLALIRQFSHEVLATATHFRWIEKLKAR